MASCRKLLLACCAALCFIIPSHGVRTKQKIYIDLETQSACFRNFNATGQVGCASPREGNVGTVYYLQTEQDFQLVLSTGQHSPYVVLMNSVDFNGTSVRRLISSGRVNGIMVINVLSNHTMTPLPPNGFSSVDSCPNDRYGLYSNHSEYKNCAKVEWNPPGSGLQFQDLGIPVYALSNASDVDNVLNKCFYPFNQHKDNETRSYPLCAAEIKASMFGAVNSVTCIRRSKRFNLSFSTTVVYCDPLGDNNVIVPMKAIPNNVTREENSVILVAARLDATALFQNEYNAADTTVTALVTMLVAAEALWRVKDEIRNAGDSKDIMFTLLQGETFDYIGSSRMVYDMQAGKFPSEYSKDSNLYLAKVNLSHVNQIVELNQVGLRDDSHSVWAHMDPLSSSSVADKVQQMIADFQDAGRDVSVDLQEANKLNPLPPASAQRLLMERRDIPTVVITDHQAEYTNKFYNSRLDTADLIDAADYPEGYNESMKYDYVTRQAELIANLSTTLARYLYKASMGKSPSEEVKKILTGDPSTATHLLYCFLISPNCELFQESVDSTNGKSLEKALQPFPWYVSTNTHVNEVTQLSYHLLARFTGDQVPLKSGDCTSLEKDKRYSLTWMQGPLLPDGSGKRVGWCIQSTVTYTEAVSPAFEIDDYDMLSGVYSTWTESRWQSDSFGIRLFLVPSQQLQTSVLVAGILLLLFSLVLTYAVHARSSVLFSSRRFEETSSITSYNPFL